MQGAFRGKKGTRWVFSFLLIEVQLDEDRVQRVAPFFTNSEDINFKKLMKRTGLGDHDYSTPLFFGSNKISEVRRGLGKGLDIRRNQNSYLVLGFQCSIIIHHAHILRIRTTSEGVRHMRRTKSIIGRQGRAQLKPKKGRDTQKGDAIENFPFSKYQVKLSDTLVGGFTLPYWPLHVPSLHCN